MKILRNSFLFAKHNSSLPGFHFNLGDILGGAVSSIIAIAYGLTFTDLIFSGPLKSLTSYGLASTFITMAVIAAVMAARSTLPFVIAGPDGSTAAVTASLVAGLVAKFDPQVPSAELLAPVMILIALSTAFTGGVLWTIGALRAANAIRFIPYPVIAGFLATTGLLLISGGSRILINRIPGFWIIETGTDSQLLGKLGSGLFFALTISLIQSRWKSPLSIIVIIISGILVGHLSLFALGMNVAQAQELGWFVQPQSILIRQTWGIQELHRFPWSSLTSLSGDILAMALVTAAATLLNTNGIEISTKYDADVQRELKSIGLANIISAACGGYVGCTSINRSILNFTTGGTSRLSGLIVAIISVGIIFSGTGFVGYVPKFILGGLVINLGVGLLNKWLFKTAVSIPRHEYVVLALVTFVNIKWGFIAGVIIGGLISSVNFAYSASRTNAVKFSFNGSEYSSSLDRSPEELSILLEKRMEVLGFILQGHLFFGSTNRLYEQVKSILAQNNECRHLIFDFALINGTDSSAMQIFRQIKTIADGRSISILYVGLNKQVFRYLNSLVSKNDHVLDNLDQALEICENDVISRHLQVENEAKDLSSWLAEELGSKALSDRLTNSCHRQEFDADQVIAKQGETAQSMYFVVSGRLGIFIETAEGSFIRVRSLGRHTTVGEMGLLTGGLRSATIIAEMPSVIYELELGAFEKMKKSDPDLCQALLTYVISVMAQRLRFANNAVGILRR